MGSEVPEYLSAGVSRDRDSSLRALDEDYLTHELLELLHHADASAGISVPHGSFVDEEPSLYFHPSPSSPPLDDSSARAVASEAEMASWLCQVFEQEASHPRSATTTTTKSERESTVGISCGASGETSAGAPADERPRNSGRRRTCSGKAAEQRRRDKINDKMRTLQQLMPTSSKTDKASTLEHVIQYVKSLQHHVQMLSASGYAMPPTATILPPGVVPPSSMHMQLAAGDGFGAQAPAPARVPVMLPPYPFVPAVFACPHHGYGTPPPPYGYLVGSGSGSATQQQLAQCRRSNDHSVRSHRRRRLK